jgi:hypothetical protein
MLLIIVSSPTLYAPHMLIEPAALKNADDMLKDVVKAMDKNGDKVIQYEGGCRNHLCCRGL